MLPWLSAECPKPDFGVAVCAPAQGANPPELLTANTVANHSGGATELGFPRDPNSSPAEAR